MQKVFLLLGAFFAGLGVVLGAFGAHGLKQLVGSETVGTFQTGVQYQMYHAFALLFVGLLYERLPASMLNWAPASSGSFWVAFLKPKMSM